MEEIIPQIASWFLNKQEHFVAFAQADSRIEGWFKAELIVLFNHLVEEKVIEQFEREANIASPIDGKRNQVDFKVSIHGQEHLCELKALCISQAAGTPRNLHFYFRDDHLGLIKDFKKLDEITHHNKWVLAFIYPAPAMNDWNKAITSLPKRLNHWKPITSAKDYPSWAYIALWKG